MRKIYLQIFGPVTALFILNNLTLVALEIPGLLIVNILSYGVIVTVAILSLKSFTKKETREIPISSLSTSQTFDRLQDNSEQLEEVYSDLKQVLANCCQKESLPVAKELARICSDLGPITKEIDEIIESKRPPAVSPFRKGALRRAYGFNS